MWGEADKVAVQLANLTRDSVWASFLDEVPLGKGNVYARIIKKVTTQHVCDFSMRVTRRLQSWPYPLLWLGKEEAHVPCARRQQVCRDMLGTSNDTLHITVLKVKYCFAAEVAACANDGTCPDNLQLVLRLVSTKWRGDTQEIEGINNLIQIQCAQCPHVTLALIDARTALKKQLRLGSKDDSRKNWSQVEPVASALLDEAAGQKIVHVFVRAACRTRNSHVGNTHATARTHARMHACTRAYSLIRKAVTHLDGINTVLARKDRWEPPQRDSTIKPPAIQHILGQPFSLPVLRWAGHYSQQIHHAMAARGTDIGIQFYGYDRDNGIVWVCGFKYGHAGQWVQCTVTAEGGLECVCDLETQTASVHE